MVLVAATSLAEEGGISEESSFYGDEEQQAYLESLPPAVNPETYWQYHGALPSTLAHKARSQTAAILHNPYEGEENAKQLDETIDEFLQRLRPSTSTWEDVGPWVRVANPHVPHHPVEQDLATLTQRGEALLEEFSAFKQQAGKGSRKVKPRREALEKDLKDLAIKTKVISGKWMLFQPNDTLDATWRAIADGVVAGNLGPSAKVATGGPDRDPSVRLICVCTKDFSDLKDVNRVLHVLVGMALIESGAGGNGIWYKSDAYTHLGIESGNEWGLKASMYASKDMLKAI